METIETVLRTVAGSVGHDEPESAGGARLIPGDRFVEKKMPIPWYRVSVFIEVVNLGSSSRDAFKNWKSAWPYLK